MTIDVVCNLDVNEEVAEESGLTSDYGGRTFHFCCAECKAAFDREPAVFAGPTEQGGTGDTSGRYTQ